MLETIIVPWLSFSVATAIVSMWQLFNPIFKELAEDHQLKKHYMFSRVSWFLLAMLVAPIILPAILVEQYRKAYVSGFLLGSRDV